MLDRSFLADRSVDRGARFAGGAAEWLEPRLASIGREIDCSHRTLISHFRKCIGQTPKATARLFRFNRVLASLNELIRQGDDQLAGKPFIELEGAGEQTPIAWADITADCGYFDQPHFIKEFKQFSGATPSEFVSRVSHVA
jgi:AraC-like DNA-binding protein